MAELLHLWHQEFWVTFVSCSGSLVAGKKLWNFATSSAKILREAPRKSFSYTPSTDSRGGM